MTQLTARLSRKRRSFLGIPFSRPDFSRVEFSDGCALVLDAANKRISTLDPSGEILQSAKVLNRNGNGFSGFEGKIVSGLEWLSVQRKFPGVSVYYHSTLGVLVLGWLEYDIQKGIYTTGVRHISDAPVKDIFMRIIMAAEVLGHEFPGI